MIAIATADWKENGMTLLGTVGLLQKQFPKAAWTIRELNSGGDFFLYVIADFPITTEQAQAAWNDSMHYQDPWDEKYTPQFQESDFVAMPDMAAVDVYGLTHAYIPATVFMHLAEMEEARGGGWHPEVTFHPRPFGQEDN